MDISKYVDDALEYYMKYPSKAIIEMCGPKGWADHLDLRYDEEINHTIVLDELRRKWIKEVEHDFNND